MPDILSPTEVQLFGTRYPIVGPVQRTPVDLFAPKVDFGDSANSDEVVLSTWTMRDWSGGLGIDNLVSSTQDQNRFSYGTLDTRFPQQLSLAPQVVSRGSSVNAITFFIDFGGELYAFGATEIFKWTEGDAVFSSFHTLGSTVVEAIVYKDTLYVTCESSDIETYDGTTWGTLSGHEARHMAVWNDTLYLLQDDGSLANYGGTTWASTGAKLDLPDGYGIQLITFFDTSNLPALYAVTKQGLWGYDSSSGIFVETAFTYPFHPNVGRACVWQGNLYIPVGTAVYRYDTQSVAVVGPDQDEGLPPSLSGSLTRLTAAHAFYYAAANGSSVPGALPDILYSAYPDGSTFISPSTANSAVLISNGTAWHVSYVPSSTEDSIGALHVSDAEGQYRLWFSVGLSIYSTDLPTSMFNPLKNPAPAFLDSGFVITPYFDSFKPQMDKTAIEVQLVARNVSTSETITVEAQWDEATTWDSIGVVTASGLTSFQINWADGGKVFRKVRFRLSMARGTSTNLSPILDSLTLTFQRRPDVVWSYQFTIDLTKQYKGKTPDQLRTLLETAVESKTAGLFYYRYGDSTPITDAMVFTTRGSGSETSGFIPTLGRFSMVLIQVKASD